MEPSDEIREALLRLYEVLNASDAHGFEQLWSHREGTLAITTDYEEWHHGIQQIVGVYRVQEEVARDRERAGKDSGEEPRIGWRPSPDLIAMQEGSVGWAIDRPHHRLPMRITAVFHLERSTWKLVHVHLSIGVSNESAYGFTAPTSIETIAEDIASERPDIRFSAAPNGTVTILFTDIEDSTQRALAAGDRRWMESLREHNALIRQQVAAQGGFEVKSQGDGFMLAFPSARDAVRAAIGIQRAIWNRDDTLRVRIGLHTGEAIREANDFYGKSVIMAARIAAAAKGGQILVSSLVHELLGGTDEFDFEQHADLQLKGLEGSHRVWTVRA